MKACGGAIQTSVNGLTEGVLGTCEAFQEEQIGGDRCVCVCVCVCVVYIFSTSCVDDLYRKHDHCVSSVDDPYRINA